MLFFFSLTGFRTLRNEGRLTFLTMTIFVATLDRFSTSVVNDIGSSTCSVRIRVGVVTLWLLYFHSLPVYFHTITSPPPAPLQMGIRLRFSKTVCFWAVICQSRLLFSSHRSRDDCCKSAVTACNALRAQKRRRQIDTPSRSALTPFHRRKSIKL